jgi:amino acid transporter
VAAAIIGGLLILFALMDVKDIHDKNIGLLGLPYIVKQALGNTAGNVFLVDSALAITVCTLAVCTACIRMLFSMARDGRLPAGRHLARVSGRARVPIIPALFVGFWSLVLLAINLANQQAFTALIGVAIIMFYLPYLGVTAPMLRHRLRGEWPRPEHGPYFSLGRWGKLVNLVAVVYGVIVAVNIAWPRAAVYGTKWYFKWAAVEFIGASLIVGALYYFLVQRRKGDVVLAEHRAEVPALPGEHVHLGEAAP